MLEVINVIVNLHDVSADGWVYPQKYNSSQEIMSQSIYGITSIFLAAFASSQGPNRKVAACGRLRKGGQGRQQKAKAAKHDMTSIIIT